MDFKFIVLALVISLAAGEGTKTESPVIGSNDKAVDLSKNEELSKVKDYVTSAKSEKLMHDVKNIAEGKLEGLPHKASMDVKSSADAVAADNGTVPDPTPAPLTDPTTTPATKPRTTTTAKSTTTTTAKPTTTTTSEPMSTTTPKPTTAPIPEQGNWTVNDSNSVCIVMQMEIEFNITYPGNTNNTYNKTIFIPKNASASGHCGKQSQNITLEWDFGNTFVISFTSNETLGKFNINSFNLTVNTTGFENITDTVKNMTYVSTKPDFPVVPLKMSYRCDKQLKQILQSSEKYNATLLVSHTQFQAFMANKTVFGEVKDCDEFDTPDIVPIAVGCVLSILVLIVLVAYLIGRRRSQSRGYLSM